ncbi:MAG: hypothetical protein C4554_03550 [Dethiobacter sp.]|jgi:Rod binding domain-containing protein|nr:MAG: hypothetical protein C4554_03550 [Dethiobacter sp.]
MKVNDISHGRCCPTAFPKNKPSEKEMKQAAQDFAAVFYEKMLAGMLKAKMGQKGLQEEVWWEMLIGEIAREISASPTTLAEELYAQLKKEL